MSLNPPSTPLTALDMITQTSRDPPKELPTKANQLSKDDDVIKKEKGSLGGARKKGECTEKGAKNRVNMMQRIKKIWGITEFSNIFPKEIEYHSDLGTSAISNLRVVATACSDLKKVQREMLAICANGDGTYQDFRFKYSKLLADKFKMKDQAALEDEDGSITVETPKIKNKKDAKPAPSPEKSGRNSTSVGKRSSLSSAKPQLSKESSMSGGVSEEFGSDDFVGVSKKKVAFDLGGKEAAGNSENGAEKSASKPINKGPTPISEQDFPGKRIASGKMVAPSKMVAPEKMAVPDKKVAPSKMGAPGKMVAPSKELAHPFSGRKPKTLEAFPKVTTNDNTAAEKPKGPFSNLLTAQSMIKKFGENKRDLKKAIESNRRNSENQLSERVKNVEKMATPGSVEMGNMAMPSVKVSESVAESHVPEGPKKTIQAKETIEELHHVQNQSNELHGDEQMRCDEQMHCDEQLHGDEQPGDESPLYSPHSPVEEDKEETPTIVVNMPVHTRTPLPTTPPNKHKRSADAMLAGSEGKDAPAERSVRPRLDVASQRNLYTRDVATNDARAFSRYVTGLTETAISNLPDLRGRRARDSAAIYFEFLESIQQVEKRLLEVARRDYE